MTVRGVNPIALGKDTFREFKDDDVPGLAAELTFRVFLALFPFLIFLAALGGVLASALNVDDPSEKFLELFGGQLPDDARSVISTQVEEVVDGRSVGLISVGIVGALWAATGGAAAMIKALNRAYDIPDTRPFWKQKLLALGLVIAGTIAILGSVSLLVATRAFGGDIADAVGLGSTFEAVLRWGTWPTLLVLALAAVAFVYWSAPNVGLPFRWISPGAVFFVLAWLAATVGFSIYVANFGSYNATYGALGGVVILLFWLYITNLVLLLGAELNAVLDEQAIGPTLQERREKAAEAMQAKRSAQPRNPDAVAGEGAVAFADAGTGNTTDHDAGRDSRPPEYPPPRQPELAPAGANPAPAAKRGPGPLVAFIGGAVVAAFAVRRFAR